MSEQNFDPAAGVDPLAIPPSRIGEPSGLPQSQLGGLHPELQARISATTAAVGDFDRENRAWIDGDGGDVSLRPDYAMWAMRLAGELRGLLETIGRLS